ncbi:FMN-binding negative transcriptional regulator [Ferroplasma sp.]|uniref:FMN-binding negative transcriptional regulator n=1 Tax=Ferroplasma sp. TaxID=2591003 RepID=UPI002606FCA2|nr:FMN-binding negative transcriptional regulator [Ferroplasma sp.]MCL4453617.1 FMN-binding negative transcriptional regulator [Candidatus Thermoplasmatota archaeon]
MYIPHEFKIEDLKKIVNFVEDNNFGILLSIYNNEIYNTQIPLMLGKEDEKFVLKGHMARANMQWYRSRDQAVTALFTGPHHYISPLYYQDKDSVPTWDYMTVRMDGKLELMDEPETRKFLLEMSQFYDEKWAEERNDKREYYSRMVLQIVGFKIRVSKITAKFKLSQNRPEDMENIAINLDNLGDADAVSVAKFIREEIKK